MAGRSNVRAMDPKARYNWSSKLDKDISPTDRFTIIYHPLDMHESAAISDEQIKSKTKGRTSEYKYLMSRADIKRMELSIIDWKNFYYPEDHEEFPGKPVPFSKENIGLIPEGVRAEFVDDLTGRNKDEDEDGIDLGEARTA